MSSESTVIQFWVNDEKVEAPAADGDMSLLNYLRDSLGLNRARYGCGAAACGACTVVCNGEAVTSCDQVLSELHGVRVDLACRCIIITGNRFTPRPKLNLRQHIGSRLNRCWHELILCR